MNRKANTTLLKEYIKTLVVTEVDFPGIQPRKWGNEFSRTELQAIHFTLKFVLKTASPKIAPILLNAFKDVDHPGMNMHWFLCDFWPEIVPLLTKFNATQIHYPDGLQTDHQNVEPVSMNALFFPS